MKNIFNQFILNVKGTQRTQRSFCVWVRFVLVYILQYHRPFRDKLFSYSAFPLVFVFSP